MSQFDIPTEVSRVTQGLQEAGFEAFLVGGCVRDLLRGEKPKDWDVTTSATPEDIQNIFEHSFYENDYGTVGVVNDPVRADAHDNVGATSNGAGEKIDPTLKVIEVTPYRIEGKYEDGRRPSEVHFSDNLEDDLKRRDFTINAIALDPHACPHTLSTDTSQETSSRTKGVGVKDRSKRHIVDLYNGQKDIKDRVIRTVGEPAERFSEDYLRMLRAARLATELNFSIDPATREQVEFHAKHLEDVSRERIRDEFSKVLMTDQPKQGVELLQKLGLLTYIVPELEEGIGVEQNQAHSYDVFEHNVRSLQHAADKGWGLDIRLAALFHDISKPETRQWSKEKKDWTFYGHDVVGARVAKRVMQNLKFPKEKVDKIRTLVRWHMFFSDPDVITLSAVRRMVRNVGGKENMWDLLNLRVCDRIGTGRPKEHPFRLRKYISMVEEAQRAPVSVGMLKMNGDILISEFNEKPGPRIGWILHALLEEVLDDPNLNTEEYMQKRAGELVKLPDTELKELGEAGKKKQEEEEEKELKEIRKKYHVK